MRDFSIAPLASDDLDGIWNYFAEFDPGNADVFVADILDIFRLLARNPFAGRLRDDINEELRFFPKDNYCIFYYPTAVGVRIMRILHASRDIETILENELFS